MPSKKRSKQFRPHPAIEKLFAERLSLASCTDTTASGDQATQSTTTGRSRRSKKTSSSQSSTRTQASPSEDFAKLVGSMDVSEEARLRLQEFEADPTF